MGKKLLAMLLCFATLLMPVLNIKEQGSLEAQSALTLLYEPLMPEIISAPTKAPVNASIGMSEQLSVSASQTMTVTVVLATDEDFRSYNYETPFGVVRAEEYAWLQIERASIWFEQTFNVELVVTALVMWHSDESEGWLLWEAIEETGFRYSVQDILIAWSTQMSYYGGYVYDGINYAAIICPQAYWTDDNTVQHEVSHLFGAKDGKEWTNCYLEQCVMSYLEYYVETITEDGKVYDVRRLVREVYLTNKWCEDSYNQMYPNREQYCHTCGGHPGEDC